MEQTTGPAPQPTRRGALILRWAMGIVVTAGRYLLHRVPFYRRNRRPVRDCACPDLERDLPGDPETLQRPSAGVGPLYHRTYEIAFTDGVSSPSQLVAALRQDPNVASPVEVSSFERDPSRRGEPLQVGEELVVRLPGPWNGPVRVVETGEDHFRLATLQGHMEAGEIGFSAGVNERGWIVFRIDSWARCGDRLFHLLYHRLPLAREMQLHMWSHFCEQVAKLAGGVVMTNVELHTCTREAAGG
jgi:hypothetical protein